MRVGTVGAVLESIKTADETPTQSGSRSQWWNGSTRTKPTSTEPLNISRLIASVWEGVLMRENVASRIRISPLQTLCTKAKVAKGGHICRTLWYHYEVAASKHVLFHSTR